ncbi:sugar phosphate isomerase/epimerase, partial [Kocuria coralli]
MTLPIASVQLYSLADEFSADMAGSLDKLAGIGLKNVEAFDFVRRPAELREAFDASGLASPTGHAPLLSDELWTPDGSIPTPAPEVVFEAASQIGMKTVIDPFVPVDRWLTEDGVKDIAERLNSVADLAQTYGLTVGYHNHSQEFLASFDGKTAFELFVSLLDPRVVIELDLFWALTGGQDVPALVESLGERLVAVHVKDGVAPASNPFAPDAPAFGSASLDQRHAGTADVPLAESLKAASNVQYAVIEYDCQSLSTR